MKTPRHTLAAILLGAGALISQMASAETRYQITITNMTQSQVFTPVLMATHQAGIVAFQPGQPAISELEAIAESGNVQPALDLLNSLGGKVGEAKSSGDVLPPGHSVTLTLAGGPNITHFMVVAMLIPTNDAFVAVNGEALPTTDEMRIYVAPAWDAGTEDNDELCSHIPGPPSVCQGEGVSSSGGEGFVHTHPGIHGVGDLNAATYDWRSPTAIVKVQRISS